MHHGHSLSTGENVLPPLSDFTIVTHTTPGVLPRMPFSDYHRKHLVNASADWDIDVDKRVIYIHHPRPATVEVYENDYQIIWEGE